MDAIRQAKGNTEVPDDAWGQDGQAGPAHNVKRQAPAVKAKTVTVRDAWDDDDDEEEEQPNEPDEKEVWEKANAAAPLPAIQLSTTTTSPVPLPPVAALQGPLRILKRPSGSPSPATSPPPTSASAQSRMTLQEREAQYQAARARIFGEAGSAASSRSPSPKSAVIREPVGPSASSDNKQGFAGRKKKPNANDAAKQSISRPQTLPKEGQTGMES